MDELRYQELVEDPGQGDGDGSGSGGQRGAGMWLMIKHGLPSAQILPFCICLNTAIVGMEHASDRLVSVV